MHLHYYRYTGYGFYTDLWKALLPSERFQIFTALGGALKRRPSKRRIILLYHDPGCANLLGRFKDRGEGLSPIPEQGQATERL